MNPRSEQILSGTVAGMTAFDSLRHPAVVMAFEGWNDAADAATGVVNHLGITYQADVVLEIDGDEFYDYQEFRPQIRANDDGERVIEWPTTSVSIARLPERDVVLVRGPEPNLRWRSFADTIVSVLRVVKPELVVVMGAMLTDTPHSRPLRVMAVSDDAAMRERFGVDPSDYEGPTGIAGVMVAACESEGMAVVSVWGSVPHYVANPPNPKATLAMLTKVEDLLALTVDLGELPELAQAWERGVDQLAADDPDVAEYVQNLIEAQDEQTLPEATGDSIAAEFQRYLRRRDAE